MLTEMRPGLVALAALSVACGGAPQRPEGRAEANPNMPDRVQPPPPSAAPRRAPVTTCPEKLDEPETIDRVIGKECGTVTVHPGYRVDGGSLTIEGGVTLAFLPGAGLAVGFERPAALRVRGSAEAPVRFTISGEARYAGAWRGLALYEHADGSEIAGLVVEYAGNNMRGTIYVQAQDVAIDDTTVRDCAGVAVHVTSKGRLVSFAHNKLERVSAPALLLPPSSVAAISADTVFPADSEVHVLGGLVRDRVRWSALTVPYVLGGPVEIEGADEDSEALLELSPGTVLRFDDDAYLTVGYDRPAALVAEAEGQAPIVMTSATKQAAGTWRGVNLYKFATASFANVLFEYGGQRVDRGALYANGEARLSVKGCRFKDNGGGVTLQGGALRIGGFGGNTFERSHPAFDVSPQALGLLGPDNTLDQTRIRLEGGTVARDAVWHDYGVPIEAYGAVTVDSGATLTIAAGVELVVQDGFTLGVGEFEAATLKILGTAEAPVSIVGTSDRRGTWDAIRLYERSHGNVIEHLKLRNAGGEGAINVAIGVDAAVRDVTCDRCFSPTLAWACGAKVAAERVTAGAETPAATLGCEGD